MEVLRRLGKLLSLQDHVVLSHPAGINYSAQPLDQILQNIDHDRTTTKVTAEIARAKEQQAKEKALKETWYKAKSLETSIKDYLAIADPRITEGLSIIARRTWRDDGFIIIKYGPSWNKDGSYVSSGDFYNIINLEAANPPPLEYLSGAEFNYHAQSVDKSKASAYDPYASYYRATLKFRDGNPYSLQFGYGTTLYEKELKMIGEQNILNRALAEYYHHGPEVYTYSGD